MVREYFLDLKRIMMEYNMYLAVYRSKRELSFKECKITCLIDPGCLFKTDTRDRFQIIKKSPYLTILYMASVRTPIFL